MFKNIIIYQFVKKFNLSPEVLNDLLAQHAFKPCGAMDQESVGWVSPLDNELFMYTANNCILFKLREQKKVLPNTAIRERVDEKITEIKKKENRKVRKREKDEIKEQVLFEMIPQAFSVSTYLDAYIDVKKNWLVINTPNKKRAETLSFLFSYLGNHLRSYPIKTKKIPSTIMTDWLTLPPDYFGIGEACTLSQAKQVACFKQMDLFSEEIQLMAKDRHVTRLAMEWKSVFSFSIDEDLVIKGLKSIEIPTEDELTDVLSMMFLNLREFIGQLLKAFGGVEKIYDPRK